MCEIHWNSKLDKKKSHAKKITLILFTTRGQKKYYLKTIIDTRQSSTNVDWTRCVNFFLILTLSLWTELHNEETNKIKSIFFLDYTILI